MLKKLKTINIVLLAISITITILSTTLLFNYGHGLGNIFFIFLSIVTTIIHAIFAIKANNRVSKKYYIITITIFSFFLFYFMYSATLGRGGEYRLNGKIFYTPNKDAKVPIVDSQTMNKVIPIK